MRGYIVHTNAVAAVQPNVAPNSISLQHDLSCVLAGRYWLNPLEKSLLLYVCRQQIYDDLWTEQLANRRLQDYQPGIPGIDA